MNNITSLFETGYRAYVVSLDTNRVDICNGDEIMPDKNVDSITLYFEIYDPDQKPCFRSEDQNKFFDATQRIIDLYNEMRSDQNPVSLTTEEVNTKLGFVERSIEWVFGENKYVADYKIISEAQIGDTIISIGKSDLQEKVSSNQEWATWIRKTDQPDNWCFGHYSMSKSEAYKDYLKRIESEVNPYDNYKKH